MMLYATSPFSLCYSSVSRWTFNYFCFFPPLYSQLFQQEDTKVNVSNVNTLQPQHSRCDPLILTCRSSGQYVLPVL